MYFTILEFEDGLQLVPSKWLVEEQGKCSFPPYLSQSRIDRAIESEEDPGKGWMKHSVETIFGTAATYKQGIKKLQLALKFLEIDNEEKFSEEPRRKIVCKHADESNGESDTCSSVSQKNLASNISDLMNCMGKFKKEVFNKLHKMSETLEDIKTELKEYDKLEVENPLSIHVNEVFPVKSEEVLQVVEDNLDDSKYFKQVVNALKVIGGHNICTLTTNILEKVLTNEVAILYSWCGEKNKRSFKDLKLYKALLESVRFHHPSATDFEVSNVVAKWLVQTKWRLEGAEQKMFSVIEFEEGLQLVPSSWVDEESMICLWPPVIFNQIKLNKMVAAQFSPEQSWTRLKVLEHYGKFDSYKRGIEKLKLCMEKSDIDTAPSEEEKARRKRVINQTDSEDETVGTLASFPKQPKKKQMLFSKNKENENLDVNDSDKIQCGQEHKKKKQCECDGSDNSSDKQFKELILGKINFIINRIHSLEEKVNYLLRNGDNSLFIGDNSLGSVELMQKFPVKDIKELKEMEIFISEEENYKTLVLSLTGIGGRSDQHVIRNILRRLLNNEVAKSYSWLGTRGKSSFKNLQLNKAILETARIHYPSMTEAMYTNEVANWLRHAKQRIEREKGYVQSSSSTG